MRKNRIIPFHWLPASWGLAGPQRAEAEAYYYLEGADLELALAEIQLSGAERDIAVLEIKKNHAILSDRDYDFAVAERVQDPVERHIAVVEAQMRHEEVDFLLGEKTIATLKGEPWIHVVNDGIDKEQGINGYFFEFDWNDIWIAQLREAGYVGPTEESIIQAWFVDVCRNEASASMGTPPISGGISGVGIVY